MCWHPKFSNFFNSFHNLVEFGTIFVGLRNFGGGGALNTPNPPLGTPLPDIVVYVVVSMKKNWSLAIEVTTGRALIITTFSTTEQKQWFRCGTVWLLCFQTVQCYMNANLQMMKRSRTCCIHGFIHNCKCTQQMLSGSSWARVICQEVVRLVWEWLCICLCVPCVE